MGWGCYKHESDAGSESWQKKIADITPENCDPWGRDGEICPWCYESTLERMNALENVVRSDKVVDLIDENQSLKVENAMLRERINSLNMLNNAHREFKTHIGGYLKRLEDLGDG